MYTAHKCTKAAGYEVTTFTLDLDTCGGGSYAIDEGISSFCALAVYVALTF